MPRRQISSRWNPRWSSWWPCLAGVLAAGGQAPVSLWPLALLGFALLFRAHLGAGTARASALAGWRFGLGYFAAALAWLVEPFMVDAARQGWMAPFALFFMSAGLALFWAAALALAKVLAPDRWLPQALTVTATLTLSEALRGWIFTGFPWALIGHGLIPSPLLPLAAFGGPLALTLALLLPATFLGAALWRLHSSRAALLPAGLAGGLLLVLGLAAPAFRPDALPAPADAPVIRLVQPNAPQNEKWLPEKSQIFFDRQLAYTAAGPRPDLVVWPETAVPYLLDRSPTLPPLLAETSRGVPVITGIQRIDPEGNFYNSMALVGGEGQLLDTYDKHHLVPFGEYLPFADLMGKLGIGALAAQFGSGYAAGPGPRLMQVPGLGAALPLICYEAVFPRDLRLEDDTRPRLLLQITNDAWFGTFSGPYQHLAQARLRAIETGLPMIRVANTGVSALIAADGEVLDSLPLGTAGYLDVSLPNPAQPTFYSRNADIPALLLAFLALFGGIAARFIRLSAPAHKPIDPRDPRT